MAFTATDFLDTEDQAGRASLKAPVYDVDDVIAMQECKDVLGAVFDDQQ